jgi:hypothetical protein
MHDDAWISPSNSMYTLQLCHGQLLSMPYPGTQASSMSLVTAVCDAQTNAKSDEFLQNVSDLQRSGYEIQKTFQILILIHGHS